MGTTPTYSWPYPEATGLVKDGWEDIKDLATAIDTTASTTFSPGLTKIASASFTTSSEVSLANDTFSATYDNYRILFELTAASASTSLTGRLRLAGTNATANSYTTAIVLNTTTTLSGVETNTTSWDFRTYNTNTRYALVLDFYRPKTTGQHLITGQFFSLNSSGVWTSGTIAGRYDVATAYDSVSFIPGSGTITGKYWVYGYRA